MLFSKSLLLESEKSVLDIVRNEGSEEDISCYRNLLALNNRLLALKNNYEYNRNEIDSLTIYQRELEQQLSSKCQGFKEYEAYLDIDYDMVKNHLTKKKC